ncbi:uncharacterized protein LOC143293748 [Babylonia areolata]|uniref:uncharacterized protein LOC143293748 n=1 Tax=Babylonia areolata TaxID=304850 RepID=UPI003FCF6C33
MDGTAVSEDCPNGGPVLLVGVCLLSDGTGELLSSLGAVVVSHGSPDKLSVSKLRQIIVDQIQSCPPNFRFYTPQRWPISSEQENCLTLQTLMTADGTVCIQQVHERPKIGIKAKTGVPLGFVFTDSGKNLADFRALINAEVSFFQGIQDTYQFLDGNGWPVSKQFEKDTRVREAMVSSCVVVCTDLCSKSKEAEDEVDGSKCSPPAAEPPRKRLKGLKQLSFRSGKDIDRQRNSGSTLSTAGSVVSTTCAPTTTASDQNSAQKDRKQLLISYVRAEAADYALQLKIKLAELGYSVYLDVHEISVGVDWQDSLNFAVSNCEVFIPLVTARYGETLWTNREVKLADVLGKYILPVNFLSDWPPRCLAIQFATTQYVVPGHPHVKSLVNGSSAGCKTSNQAANWSDGDVKLTASEISQRLKVLNKTGATLLSIPSLVRMKTLRKTFVGKLPAVKSFASEAEGDIPPSNTRPLIVICLHPTQAAFGQEVKLWLENKSYTVWLSSEDDYPVVEAAALPPADLSEAEQQANGEDKTAVNGAEGGDQIAPFQSVADRAAVVVVILSQNFAHSHTCKQQLFYCEQRKPLIPVHFEDFTMPGWLSMLIGTESTESRHIKQDNYKQTILARLQRVIHSATRNNLEQLGNEAKLSHAVDYIRKTVQTDSCLYIAGSTNFYNPKSEEICRSIGKHLAQLEGLSMATGGFYGVGETVSQAYHEETQRLWKRQDVWHILPDRDAKDWRKQANQNSDGTFAVASFGKTLFCGDSVRQRESIVGRCFEICILIEGGPGAAHEAEEFVWNDRTVIPLRCTGGAASGKFSVPQKMFEKPQGVSSQDWQALTNPDLTPDKVAECVARIVSSLLLHLSASKQQAADSTPTPTPTPASPPHSPSHPPLTTQKASPPTPARVKSALNKMKTVILG